MRPLLASFLLVLLMVCGNVYPQSQSQSSEGIFPATYSDEQLWELAVQKGVIPPDPDQAYFDNVIEENDSGKTWILIAREVKIRFAEEYMKVFKEEEGATFRKPPEYYVDKVSTALCSDIINGTSSWEGPDVLRLFKTIAVMEGDFDVGKGKVETLKEWLGEKGFEWYKEEFPEKYQEFVESDSKAKK